MVQLSSRQLNSDSDLDLNEKQILQVEGITLNEPGAGTVEKVLTINNSGDLLYDGVPVISSTGEIDPGAAGAIDIGSLVDMNIPVAGSRADGTVLTWQSGEWIMTLPSGGGGGVSNPLSETLDTGGNTITANTGNLVLQAPVGEAFITSANSITINSGGPIQANNHIQLASGRFIRRTPTGVDPTTDDPYIDTNVSGTIVFGSYDITATPNAKYTFDVSGSNPYIFAPDADGAPGAGDVLTLDSDLTTIKFAPSGSGTPGLLNSTVADQYPYIDTSIASRIDIGQYEGLTPEDKIRINTDLTQTYGVDLQFDGVPAYGKVLALVQDTGSTLGTQNMITFVDPVAETLRSTIADTYPYISATQASRIDIGQYNAGLTEDDKIRISTNLTQTYGVNLQFNGVPAYGRLLGLQQDIGSTLGTQNMIAFLNGLRINSDGNVQIDSELNVEYFVDASPPAPTVAGRAHIFVRELVGQKQIGFRTTTGTFTVPVS